MGRLNLCKPNKIKLGEEFEEVGGTIKYDKAGEVRTPAACSCKPKPEVSGILWEFPRDSRLGRLDCIPIHAVSSQVLLLLLFYYFSSQLLVLVLHIRRLSGMEEMGIAPDKLQQDAHAATSWTT